MNYGRIKIFLILIAAIILAIMALFFVRRRYQTVIVEIPKFNHPKAPLLSPSSLATSYLLPATLLLPVPFTPQAPTANWDQLHNEACEEAGAIMAAQYFSGNHDANLPADLVEKQIADLTLWQDQNFGYHLDTTSAETAEMMQKVYGLKTKLIENFSADDIKNAIAGGKLVIISENGRLLGNPFYKQPGPLHHMLVVRGYSNASVGTPTSQGASGQPALFITNDSGTKRGLNYFYDFDILYNAAADWSHDDNTVHLDKKIAIVVWK